jgi:hypothetical protein
MKQKIKMIITIKTMMTTMIMMMIIVLYGISNLWGHLDFLVKLQRIAAVQI